MPFGLATFCSIAPVTPEQSPPTMPLTLSEVTSLSVVATAAALSIQVESPLKPVTVAPPNRAPLSETSFIASSAACAIGCVRDSIGPVKPNTIPNLMSSADAAPAIRADAVVARSNFFIFFSLVEHF